MHRVGYYFIVFFALGAVFLPRSSAGQVAPVSSWLKSEAPVFSPVQPDVPLSSVPSSSARPCTPNTKFVTIPKNILKSQAESSYTGCSVQTAFGQQNINDGAVQLHNTGVSGLVKSATGGTLNLTPIPTSKHVMYTSGGSDGSYYFMVKDFVDNMTILPQLNGSVQYQLKVPGISIKDTAGNSIQFYTARYSDNGRWLIGEVPQRGMTRVNLETGETLVFGPAINHLNGIRPSFISAVSGDGRYAITAESRYDNFRIYDLSTCIPNIDQTKTANCQWRNLLPTAQAQIGGFTNLLHAQFSTNNSVRLHVQYTGQAGVRYGLFSLTAHGEKESLLDYLALGDSFASGEGAYNYKPGTDLRNPFNKCHLSQVSYPFLLSARARINSAQSVACSGAHLKDIHFPDGESGYNNNHKQANGKENDSFTSEILASYLPGFRTQNSFVEQTKPSQITMSISGNDIGFGDIILACIKPGTCFADPQDKLNLTYTINSKFDQLVSTYQRLKDSAGTGANIYIVGYPLLVDPNGNCAINVRFEKQELIFVNQLVSYFDSVIKRATQKAGVSYIDVENAFAGYRLCETDSSQVAVNGLTAGDDKTISLPLPLVDRTADVYITGRESYHPNQLGHRLLADAIGQATNNLALKNPTPASATANPTEAQATTLLAGVPASLSPKRIHFDPKLTNNVLLAGASNQLQATRLQPNSDATVWLRTDSKLNLGTYRASLAGTVGPVVTMPADIQPGYYPLELHAKNNVGEEIIIQKTVYIAASAQDFDADGIPNTQELCLSVNPANTDRDKDNLDDACDNFINTPPTPPLTPQNEQNTNTAPLGVESTVRALVPAKPLIAVGGSATAISLPVGTARRLATGVVATQPPAVLGVATVTPQKPSRQVTPAKQPDIVSTDSPSSSTNTWWLLIILIATTCSYGTYRYVRWRKRA